MPAPEYKGPGSPGYPAEGASDNPFKDPAPAAVERTDLDAIDDPTQLTPEELAASDVTEEDRVAAAEKAAIDEKAEFGELNDGSDGDETPGRPETPDRARGADGRFVEA